MISELDRRLCQALCDHPRRFDNRYTQDASNGLLEILFRSLTNDRADYLKHLFPSSVHGGFFDGRQKSYRLRNIQGAEENAEYTESARGHACGHIFKQGEASYHCMTCTDDPTAVLCSRCFVASDHEDHQFHIGTSAGNSGCCDCGDDEAWKRPVHCAIHTARDGATMIEETRSTLPDDLQTSIRTTISRALDYFCDIISCSPENLRTPKSTESIKQDELSSRLNASQYVNSDEVEVNPEFCLVMWNDEKHTIQEVQDQVSRACRQRNEFGLLRASEANDIGRSVVRHSRNLAELLRMAKIIEHIKITVTIRSSRDTFREQMCGTIIEWLSDIAGCHIFGDSHILRNAICEEMLKVWKVGSNAWNAKVGKNGLDDHECEDDHGSSGTITAEQIQLMIQRAQDAEVSEDELDVDEDGDGGEMVELDEDFDIPLEQQVMDVLRAQRASDRINDPEVTDDAEEMDTDGDNDFLDATERMDTETTIPPPPPPAPGITDETEPAIAAGAEGLSRQGSGTVIQGQNENYRNVPRTPTANTRYKSIIAKHWRVAPSGFPSLPGDSPVWEDLKKNIRVDSMILFDLRLWKQTRIDLRDLLITTVINIPRFKRILGLRFAGLYTTLAQLYLVADREPDHSIINLSLQLLTTPSITEEVVEKGNFLTNLLAILYTFLTTRQVGYPSEVDPEGTLGFDAGSVANRRLYHFFTDLRFFLASPFIQTRIREEKQYLHQYLDLAKLSQGICPNVRAVGEHVEYETDAWISASLLTREINKLCRQFSEAYQISDTDERLLNQTLPEAIYETAASAILLCSGLEYKRFEQSEIKQFIKFHPIILYCGLTPVEYEVVDFAVQRGTLSFHHPLHYTLSWLLENGKDTRKSIEGLQRCANDVVTRLKEHAANSSGNTISTLYKEGEDALLALFDYPIRVCAWLAQMKANMWVRNGMSLRHQMNQYKSVTYRDVGHHRDIFLLQTALVACKPDRVLASILDRYGLVEWASGTFKSVPEVDDGQALDLAEDFVYLLINILSDRDSLMSHRDQKESQLSALRKDIAHTLCFKPLSFSDLSARLTERAQDHEQLQVVLELMTNYRPPEGLHDTGMFELKPEYLQELDPYNSHFSKNQRDEAENIYKNWMAKKLKKPAEDVVLEPKLHIIRSEAFSGLCAVVHDQLFLTSLHSMLYYAAFAKQVAPTVSATRAEAFLHVVLHLALIATMEDDTVEDGTIDNDTDPPVPSFIQNALSLHVAVADGRSSSVIDVLHKLWKMEEYTSCRSKIRHMLRLFHSKRPSMFGEATKNLDFPAGRFDTASPANLETEMEAKKKLSMERKAKIMAQMQQQQQNFMDNQGMTDWGDEDLSDEEPEIPTSTETRLWKFPSGVCIQCREETNDNRLYGTFAMVSDAHVLRETPVDDLDFVYEALAMPRDLNKSIEMQRPFGVSGANHEHLRRLDAAGNEVVVDRQGLGKGWSPVNTRKGPVSTSCAHIMHFACFESYYQSIIRRHGHQIARNHPERIVQKEFVCPLCKALANIFLPIVWKSTEQSYPSSLQPESSYEFFLEETLPTALTGRQIAGEPLPLLAKLEKGLHMDTIMSFTNTAMLPLVALLSNGVSPTDRTSDWTDYPGAAALAELSTIYSRLRKSLEIVVKTQTPFIEKATNPPREINYVDILLDTLSNSVSAIEIAYRGRDSEYGSSLLSGIPSQTLSHLQILAHSVHSYAATTALTTGDAFGDQYRDSFEEVFYQFFGLLGKHYDAEDNYWRPLLMHDGFDFFAKASMVLCRMQNFPIHHVLRVCLTLELVRVALRWLWDNSSTMSQIRSHRTTPETVETTFVAMDKFNQQALSTVDQQQVEGTRLFLNWIGSLAGVDSEFVGASRADSTVTVLAAALQAYALPFLRKAAIMMHVAHGVDLPVTTGTAADRPELERLTNLLHLPKLSVLMTEFSTKIEQSSLRDLAEGWHRRWTDYCGRSPDHLHPSIKLGHPAPYELIGLPKYFDVLMEESHKRRCPTTGKELTDPALCLFCGAIFCSQAVCCMTDKQRGGCNHHLEHCSNPIGLFLLIRKCQVVLLHVVKDPKKVEQDRTQRARGQAGVAIAEQTICHGSYFPAPYLTKHGETDSGLRSKHQLILNQKRYDKLLRDTWLMVNGSVWSTVARKLEGEVNAGGWETL